MTSAGKRKINVLFVMVQMAMGGSERLIHSLVLHLDRRRYNPHVAWFYGEETLKEFRDLQVPLFYVPKVRRFDLSTMRRMSEIIRENQIHVVNAHHFVSVVYSFYGCKIRNKARLIYTAHSRWEIEQVSWKWKQIGRRLLARAEGVVGVTPEVSGSLCSNFRIPDQKCFTIENGVDIERFEKKDRREIVRKELGLQNDDKVIGMVANFKRVKNHIFLLEAFYRVFQKDGRVKLLLVGQGFSGDPDNTEGDIRKFVGEKGLTNHVLVLGSRSDVPDLLSAMDLFCLTSLVEGMPISLIEAMAAGLPIVGTNVQGIRDVVRPKANGFLVQLGDVEGFSELLQMLIEDDSLRKKMGEESKSIAKNHSLSRSIMEYERLFDSNTESALLQSTPADRFL